MSENDVVIKVENLGKQYIIGHQNDRERYHSLRDTVAQTCKNLIRTTKDILTGKPVIQGDNTEEVWALKDVNFEVKRGESLGIIGRNGAGKSTLLKILSRITEPTTGKVTIKGRVASLLEVGTGFHPELSGRENIFLNGAILGMTYKEIKSKFDEIVAFAEVEKYLDTPVKRYSSGMYVRLAFSVAAHLEPDILVVDEVLAVGDAAFQKKCLGKMDAVTKAGRTVLFVSHNINTILKLCDKSLVLANGTTNYYGCVKIGAKKYLEQSDELSGNINMRNSCVQTYNNELFNIELKMLTERIETGGEFCLEMEIEAFKKIDNASIAVSFKDFQETPVCQIYSEYTCQPIKLLRGSNRIKLLLKHLPLVEGKYILNLWIGQNFSTTLFFIKDCKVLQVFPGPTKTNSKKFYQNMGYPVIIDGEWLI